MVAVHTMSVLKKLRDMYMRENYQPLEPSQLKEEAERLQRHLSQKAAGRVCWQDREDFEDREAGFENIRKLYEEKKLWYRIVGPYKFYSKPR